MRCAMAFSFSPLGVLRPPGAAACRALEELGFESMLQEMQLAHDQLQEEGKARG